MRYFCKYNLDHIKKGSNHCTAILQKFTFNIFSHHLITRGGGYRIICESIDDNFEKELRQLSSVMKCTVNQTKIESGESVDVRKILISFDVYKKCIN